MKKKVTFDNVSYELDTNNSSAQITYSPYAHDNVFIPKSIKYENKEYIFTTIQTGSFKNNHLIKSIKFDDDSRLFSIQNKSFSNSSIEIINIPSSVEILEKKWRKYANELQCIRVSPNNPHFKQSDENPQIIVGKSDKNSDIQKITIPAYIKHLPPHTFENCYNLRKIEFSENSQLQTIGRGAFIHTSIHHIIIPSSVEELQKGWCFGLKSVQLEPNKNFKYIDQNRQIIVGKSDKNSEDFDVLVFADRKIEEVKISSNIRIIESNSFENCDVIQKVEFSADSKLHSICKNAFMDSNIQYLYIPSNVEILEDGWCSRTKRLNKVEISPFNKNFRVCNGIIEGKSDKNSEEFDILIFASRDISSVSISPKITKISPYAFEYCTFLSKINFEKNYCLQTIGKFAFASTKIDQIIIPKTVEKMDKGVFWFCKSLKDVIIENDSKLESFSSNLFFYCENLRNLELPKNLKIKSICKDAFSFTSIEKLFIPSTVETIEDGWCNFLEYLNDIELSPENKNFKYLNSKIIVGKSDKNSEDFDVLVFACRDINEVIIPSYIKRIASFAFSECSSLSSIEIPENSELLLIDNSSFEYSSIEKIFIPSKFECFGPNWCNGVNELKQIEISPDNKNFKFLDSQIIVGKSDKNSEDFDVIIFCNRDVESAIIPSNIKYISSYAFENCSQLKSIEFQSNSKLISIGEYAFSKTDIETITIPKNVEQIGFELFNECENLKTFKIEKGSKIKKMPSNLFDFCSQLNSIEIPEESSIISFERGFCRSSPVREIYIPSSVQNLEKNWCIRAKKLIDLKISPLNKNFKYLSNDNKTVVLGKSDIDVDNFDVLVFASIMIKNITVPESVERFNVNFSNFKNLNSFEFLGNVLLDDCDFLVNFENILVASFPNIEVISFESRINMNSNFRLYIPAGTKIIVRACFRNS